MMTEFLCLIFSDHHLPFGFEILLLFCSVFLHIAINPRLNGMFFSEITEKGVHFLNLSDFNAS